MVRCRCRRPLTFARNADIATDQPAMQILAPLRPIDHQDERYWSSCAEYRGCVCGAIDAWVRGRAASSTSLRLRRYCTLANPGLDARGLQQAATSNIQSGTS